MSDPATPVPDLTLTSYNARWGRTMDDTPFDLAATCAAFDTDVIVVQEVWNPHDGPAALAVAAEAGGYHRVEEPQSGSFVVPRPEITDDPELIAGTWGVALLSRLPVRAVRPVALGKLIDRWDVADRVAIVADLAVGDATVTVAAVHLSFVLPNAVAQLRRLGAALPADRPTVVAGDCNLWGPLAATALGRRRAVRGRTWPARRPHSQLDHVLVSDDVTVVDGRILPPAGSDHLPIQVTLRV